MSDVKSQMTIVACHRSHVTIQMSNLRCQMSNVKCQMSDVTCQMSNVNNVKILSERYLRSFFNQDQYWQLMAAVDKNWIVTFL